MDTIIISVSRQLDGFNFYLDPLTRRQISEEFPNSFPLSNIFVNFDNKLDFNRLYGRLEEHLVPALVGVSEDELVKKGIIKIDFLEMPTRKKLREIDLKNVQKKQSLSR